MKHASKDFFSAILYCVLLSFASCTARGPAGLFGSRSAHEVYSDKLISAGLNETALGKSWFQAADKGLSKALSISLPYSEAGYFGADKPNAAGFRFMVKRGEKLSITATKKALLPYKIYMDLWKVNAENNKHERVASADTGSLKMSFEVKREGFYILRLQPELLASIEYQLSITTGPSLAFPVLEKANAKIGSFWGANRDNGERKHEGIDIFAPMRTPLVAAADGSINRVEETKLGGKVIFLRPHNQDYTLYYAHLDEQQVKPGQQVKAGDIIGLMGKTGNAATTSPHLHFGIYAMGRAIDPLAFVDPVIKKPAAISVGLDKVGDNARTNTSNTKLYGAPSVTPSNYVNVSANTLVEVQAASAAWYKVVTPDGQTGIFTRQRC